MIKIGDRVGAIIGVENKIVTFLGYGVFEGDFYPEDAVGFIANALRFNVEKGKAKKEDKTNPRIKLDNGGSVYGCECWWGSEEKVKKELEKYKKAGYEIKLCEIEDIRNEHKKEDLQTT